MFLGPTKVQKNKNLLWGVTLLKMMRPIILDFDIVKIGLGQLSNSGVSLGWFYEWKKGYCSYPEMFFSSELLHLGALLTTSFA